MFIIRAVLRLVLLIDTLVTFMVRTAVVPAPRLRTELLQSSIAARLAVVAARRSTVTVAIVRWPSVLFLTKGLAS
jgi:hypothetical protein